MAKKKTEEEVNYNEYIKIIGIVAGICIFGYLFTAIFITGEMDFRKPVEEEIDVTIQYDEITAGQILTRSEAKYYVFIYDFEEDDKKVMRDTIFEFSIDRDIYTVDSGDAVNSHILGEANIKVSNIEDLRVEDDTLLVVKNGKIIYATDGYGNIVDYFNK